MATKTLEPTQAEWPSNRSGERPISTTQKCISRISVVLVSLWLAAVVVAPSAHAQRLATGSTTDVGLAVGAAFPQGDRLGGVDVADGTNTGFTVVGLVGVRPVSLPVSFRLEAQYTRLGLSDAMRVQVGGSAPVIADGTASIFSGSGNVVLAVPTVSRLRPYLIGGVGIYRLSSDIRITTPSGTAIPNGAPSEGETKFGLNGGAGLELAIGSLRTFVEARFHSVFTEDKKANSIPIVMGVKF